MTDLSGTTFFGLPLSKDDYEYYRLVLDQYGELTVSVKRKGGTASTYSGTYEYSNGRITAYDNCVVMRMFTGSGYVDGIELFNYLMGVITQQNSVWSGTTQLRYNITFTRVTES